MKMWTDFVDATFVVNLADRKDRLALVNEELAKHSISFVTWTAVKDQDGKKGLRDTMRYLFLHCVEAGYKRVCVFEDDVDILLADFNEIMENCVEQLPKDFHLFYMGGRVVNKPVRISPNILQSTAIYSTHAVIYTKETIQKVLLRLGKNIPYDDLLVTYVQQLGKTYCAFPLLISQLPGHSDIEKRYIDWTPHLDKKYEKMTKGI